MTVANLDTCLPLNHIQLWQSDKQARPAITANQRDDAQDELQEEITFAARPDKYFNEKTLTCLNMLLVTVNLVLLWGVNTRRKTTGRQKKHHSAGFYILHVSQDVSSGQSRGFTYSVRRAAESIPINARAESEIHGLIPGRQCPKATCYSHRGNVSAFNGLVNRNGSPRGSEEDWHCCSDCYTPNNGGSRINIPILSQSQCQHTSTFVHTHTHAHTLLMQLQL